MTMQKFEDHVGIIAKASFEALKRMRSMAQVGYYIPHEYLNEDDMYNEFFEVFERARKAYKPELKYTFSTYFTTCATNHLNKLTTSIVKQTRNTVSISSGSSNESLDDDADSFDLQIADSRDSFGVAELENLVKFIHGGLSPLAQVLFEQSINPHPIFEQEWQAQLAKVRFAKEIGLGQKAVSTKMNLRFIVRILLNTTTKHKEKVFLHEAMQEIKDALTRELSN